MRKVEQLTVKYRGQGVGTLTLTPDNKLCAFEYDKAWLLDGFSISPLELPLKQGIFVAKSQPFYGNFGIFEDSLPDGYGRYLLHKALKRVGINDTDLSSLDRLSIVGTQGMGALTYHPHTLIEQKQNDMDLDILQQKALEVLQ
jgi:serine/threonine-protein kinase HipA